MLALNRAGKSNLIRFLGSAPRLDIPVRSVPELLSPLLVRELRDFFQPENDRLARELIGRDTLFTWDDCDSEQTGLTPAMMQAAVAEMNRYVLGRRNKAAERA
jgi:hypothetical protein